MKDQEVSSRKDYVKKPLHYTNAPYGPTGKTIEDKIREMDDCEWDNPDAYHG